MTGARGGRLVVVAASGWLCAAVAVLQPGVSGAAAATLWLGVAGAVVAMLRRPSSVLAVGVVTLLASAVVVTHVATAQSSRVAAGELAGGGRSIVAEATVTGRVAASVGGDVWFDALAHRLHVGDRRAAMSVPIRVGVPADDADSLHDVDLGSSIVVRGTGLDPDPGDRAVVVLRAHEAIEAHGPPPGVLGLLADLRESLAATAAELPGPGAALVPGLAVGDTSAVDALLDEAMTASSLSHLTAVSGANCAIVVGAVFALAALCRARRAVRVAAAVGTLSLFVVLVTPEPSVVRAGTMAAIAMLAVALGRPGAGLSALALAVVVLLALDPWLALELGFGLSAVATAALLTLAGPLTRGLARFLPHPLALAVAIPLSAQLACAPLLVLVDPRVPLLGVVANMLAAPASPLATMAGFLGCLTAPLPWVQDGLVALAWLPASWIASVALTLSAVPAQSLPWVDGLPGMVLLAVLGAAVAAAVGILPGAARWRRWTRGLALVVVAVTVGSGAGHTVLVTVGAPLAAPSSWVIAMCDVGQGDAVLLRSAGVTALFDTGPAPDALADCLRRFAVDDIDLLVLTHFDLDHVGGAAAVAGRVHTVMHGPVDPGKGEPVLGALERGGAEIVEVRAGARGTLGGAQWEALWPPSSVPPGNDASVVLSVEGGGVPSTVLLGDLSAEPQARLRAAVAHAQVVKVAHHGSADQDPALYQRIDAVLALVPVGSDNDYGHPRASLLGMLTAQGARIARTDLDGDIALWLEEGSIRLWREHGVGAAG